jgi:hypothetical protein
MPIQQLQAIANGSLSIKGERGVGLSEMVMTANLYRPIAGIRDVESDGRSSFV